MLLHVLCPAERGSVCVSGMRPRQRKGQTNNSDTATLVTVLQPCVRRVRDRYGRLTCVRGLPFAADCEIRRPRTNFVAIVVMLLTCFHSSTPKVRFSARVLASSLAEIVCRHIHSKKQPFTKARAESEWRQGAPYSLSDPEPRWIY